MSTAVPASMSSSDSLTSLLVGTLRPFLSRVLSGFCWLALGVSRGPAGGMGTSIGVLIERFGNSAGRMMER